MKGLTIGNKVLLLTVGVILSICIILGVINYISSSKSMTQALEMTLSELAKTGATAIQEKVDMGGKLLETIAERNVMKSGDWELQKAAMIDEVAKTEFQDLSIVDLNGHAKCHDGSQLNVSDRQYFKEAITGKTFISGALVSRTTNKVVFIVATPLHDKNHQLQGLLTGCLPGTYFSDVSNKLSYGESGYAYIVDNKGTFLAHRNHDLVLNQDNYLEKSRSDSRYKEHAAILERMIKGETGTDKYSLDGQIRYMGFAPIEGTSWSLAIGSYASEALAPVKKMLVSILISSLVLGVIFTLIGIGVGRSIGKQIRNINTQIQGVVEAVINGNLKERFDVSSISIDFKESVEGLNNLIEAFYKPIGMTLNYIDNIARGEIPPEITDTYHGDFNRIKNSLNQCVSALNSLLGDVDNLIDAGVKGQLLVRADAKKHNGEYGTMVAGINQIIDSIITLIDLSPTPFMVIDKEYNIQFMNKSGADVIGKTQQNLVGLKCYDQFKTGDCQSENCALRKCMKSGVANISETHARPGGHELDIEYRGMPVRDRDGQIIGALEVVMDLTKIKTAQRLTEKVNDYQKVEVEKVLERLELLAQGNMNFETTIASTDADTKQTGENFEAINRNLEEVKNALGRLIDDARELVVSATDGRLQTRAKADNHNGAYKDLVQGINKLMDAVVNPIRESMNVMRELANKNMTARVKGNYKGDLNEFKQNINNAGDNLEDALIQVDRAVQQISSASGEISNGSQALASGSSEQASSLEEIASSLEEMNSLTLNNADNAKQGMTLSEQSLKHVMTGNSAMTRMNSAMGTITKSAKETSNIIKTINDIAFQTNLLALNAAVEAAHAGEAGKGFAVVAEEVKNLALRSAEAAKNTDELIESSLKNSEDGAKIVEEVTKSFEDIQTSFTKVNNIVKEISVSSDEQSEGIKQINTAVGELNKVTQANAANAEESASAAEELNSQSSELRSMVQEFKLTNSTGIGGGSKRFDDRPQQLPNQAKKKALPKPSGGGSNNKYGNQDIEIILPMDGDSEQDF